MQPSALPYRLYFANEHSAWNNATEGEPETFNLPDNSFAKPHQATQRIDHILYRCSQAKVIARQVIFKERIAIRDISLSDHAGLLATFSITPFDSDHHGDKACPNDHPAIDTTLIGEAERQTGLYITALLSSQRTLYFEFALLGLITLILIILLVTKLAGPALFRQQKLFLLLLLATSASLTATWSLICLFRAFAWCAEELAAHGQFLQELYTYKWSRE